MNRSIQVEGAFGVIKQDYGFRRFFMRGNIKVRTEFLLMAFGYNVNKLYHKTIQNRNGELLHNSKLRNFKYIVKIWIIMFILYLCYFKIKYLEIYT